MDLLAALTETESDRLWWRLVRALAAVTDEIDCLSLAPPSVRDALYGAGCLTSYRALQQELVDLAANETPRTVSSWKNLLDDNPEKGSSQWHDSAVTHPTSRPPKWRSLTRLSQLSSRGRNLTARLRSYLSKSCAPFWPR